MRALIIDGHTKAIAARVVQYAQTHPYNPFAGGPDRSVAIPGDNPQHVAEISTYRCVFTYSYSPNAAAWCRHLSVSVPGAHYTNPFAMWTIASDLFGFTGWDGANLNPPDDWTFTIDKDAHCIVLAQILPRELWP